MLTNIIYFAVFAILVFVLSIAVKAITRGVEAKQVIKDENKNKINEENENKSLEVVDQLKELKEIALKRLYLQLVLLLKDKQLHFI